MKTRPPMGLPRPSAPWGSSSPPSSSRILCGLGQWLDGRYDKVEVKMEDQGYGGERGRASAKGRARILTISNIHPRQRPPTRNLHERRGLHEMSRVDAAYPIGREGDRCDIEGQLGWMVPVG